MRVQSEEMKRAVESARIACGGYFTGTQERDAQAALAAVLRLAAAEGAKELHGNLTKQHVCISMNAGEDCPVDAELAAARKAIK